MPELITAHLTHFSWAAVCLLVAVLVHFWPTIKAKAAAGWASLKASFQRDEAKARAVGELVEQAVQGEVKKVTDATSASVMALVTRIETLERAFKAAVEAQVQADASKVASAAPILVTITNPPGSELAQEAEPVKAWAPPAAPQA